MIRFQTDGRIEILNGPLVLPQVGIINPPVVVNLRKIRFQTDGRVVILNGLLALPQVGISNPPIIISHCKIRFQADGLVQVFNSLSGIVVFSVIPESDCLIKPVNRRESPGGCLEFFFQVCRFFIRLPRLLVFFLQ